MPICRYCRNEINNQADFATHEQAHMQGKRPYVCHICNRWCLQKNHLAQHMRIHTNEKPFVCSDCGKKFIQSGNLNRHQKTHAEVKSLFKCHICSKKYTRQGRLKEHIQNNHFDSMTNRTLQSTYPPQSDQDNDLSEYFFLGVPPSPPPTQRSSTPQASASGWNDPLIANLITRRPPPHLNQPSSSVQRGSPTQAVGSVRPVIRQPLHRYNPIDDDAPSPSMDNNATFARIRQRRQERGRAQGAPPLTQSGIPTTSHQSGVSGSVGQSLPQLSADDIDQVLPPTTSAPTTFPSLNAWFSKK
ncbi:C2H2-type zinc finger protein [Xenorhabdus innexi]|uniref:C2H2 transcription factor Crz1 n=1 Tax=Xenorhabdus innexi TaxID=290109 RepID=A0A1N6N0V3_9GAMM|nr:C2H2-type zinc finger protein [Xenorhabdus innexi]PHM31302.1 C2H2 transcription factor Crz1 [Xenorhabdus innexi]SIP74753.1 hypothetical protein XIS1_840022 [Xenorhabdus innexi]